MNIGHIELFKDTKCWEIAKAVYEQDEKKISKLCENDKSLVDFHEKHYQITLLHWAVDNNRYLSARALLECGADVNALSGDKSSPLFFAVVIDDDSARFTKLLLSHGAKVNVHSASQDAVNSTPLIEASGHNLSVVKTLVEAGANVNDTVGEYGLTALYHAATSSRIEIVEYLIMKCHADYMHPIIRGKSSVPHFVKELDFPIGSPEYEARRRVLEYISQQK